MRKFGILAAAVGAIVAGACAPKVVPAPVVTTPKFPDFVIPAVPSSLAETPAVINHDRGWRFLQVGDLRAAEREFGAALKAQPGFYPAEAGLGYLELARKDPKTALPHFDRAIERQKGYASALAGRGDALVALNRTQDALASFDAALAVDPSLGDVRRRVEVLKFRGVEEGLGRARQAAKAGRLDEAIAAYAAALASSPDSPFLYREIGTVEQQKGDLDRALEHLRKATALDPSDARSFAQIGDILETRRDFDGAARAFGDALSIESNADVEAKLDAVRGRAELARLPAEFRAIDEAPQITRADLAALIGVRLASLVQGAPRRDAVVITDIRTSWAAPWIMSVARAGIMEPYANHTFGPRAAVRRIDLAQAVGRLLGRVAALRPNEAKSWQSARVTFADLSPGHLQYPAASMAVASGVMAVEADNTFQPSRVVTGVEAAQAIAKLEALAGGTEHSRGGR